MAGRMRMAALVVLVKAMLRGKQRQSEKTEESDTRDTREKQTRDGIEPSPNPKARRLAKVFGGSHQPAARTMAREPDFFFWKKVVF